MHFRMWIEQNQLWHIFTLNMPYSRLLQTWSKEDKNMVLTRKVISPEFGLSQMPQGFYYKHLFCLQNMSYHELLKIVLDKTPPIYVPGETIHGKVILNPTATITIRGKKYILIC